MNNPVGEKWYFIRNTNDDVVRQVGEFGEYLCSPILNSEIFSGTDSPLTSADLFNCDEGIATQVKMCNGKHSESLRPNQVETLYQELINGFRICHGIYALVFYRGVRTKTEKGKTKQYSIIKSRGLSPTDRAEILAQELQYIYLVDIRLLRFIKRHHPKLLLRKKARVNDGRPHKKDDHLGFCINRTFVKGFFSGLPLQKKLLDRAFALGNNQNTRGMTTSCRAQVKFQGKSTFEKEIPIFMIGRGDTVKAIQRQIQASCSLKIVSDRQLISTT